VAVCVAVRSSVCCSSWQCVLQFVAVCDVLYLVYYHVHIYNIWVVTEIVQIPSFPATNILTWTFDFQTNAALATFWDPVFSSKKSLQKRDFQHQDLSNFCWFQVQCPQFLEGLNFCMCALQCVAVCCSVLQIDIALAIFEALHMNALCDTHECVTSHVWMRHVSHMSHTYESLHRERYIENLFFLERYCARSLLEPICVRHMWDMTLSHVWHDSTFI